MALCPCRRGQVEISWLVSSNRGIAMGGMQHNSVLCRECDSQAHQEKRYSGARCYAADRRGDARGSCVPRFGGEPCLSLMEASTLLIGVAAS